VGANLLILSTTPSKIVAADACSTAANGGLFSHECSMLPQGAGSGTRIRRRAESRPLNSACPAPPFDGQMRPFRWCVDERDGRL